MATGKNGTANGATAEPRILTWDEIVAVEDLGSDTVLMPEWGENVAVRIRGLSMDDLYKARRAGEGIEDPVERRAVIDLTMVELAIVEPAPPPGAIAVLRQKSSDAIPRLIGRVAVLNRATEEARKAAEAEFPAQRPG